MSVVDEALCMSQKILIMTCVALLIIDKRAYNQTCIWPCIIDKHEEDDHVWHIRHNCLL